MKRGLSIFLVVLFIGMTVSHDVYAYGVLNDTMNGLPLMEENVVENEQVESVENNSNENDSIKNDDENNDDIDVEAQSENKASENNNEDYYFQDDDSEIEVTDDIDVLDEDGEIFIEDNNKRDVTYNGFECQIQLGKTNIIKYIGEEEHVIVPAVVGGAEVQILGDVFKDNTHIKSVTLPAGIMGVGKECFSGCTSLESVSFNYDIKYDSIITSIPDNLCKGCSSLTSFQIPESVTHIGSSAFEGCSSLKTIDIPSNVFYIGSNAFKDCVSLGAINIPDSVMSIGTYVFSGCTNLQSVRLSNNCDKVTNGMFYNCSHLKNIEIPNCVKYLQIYSFSGCTALESVHLGDNIQQIPNYGFENCTSLKGIEIPTSVINIYECAFSGCTALESIEIPESVITIDKRAFWRCENLQEVVLKDGLKYLKANVFEGCNSLEKITIPSTVEKIEGTFNSCKGIKNIEILASITAIGDYAFSKCENLEEVRLPESINSIGGGAFEDCRALKSVNIPSGVTEIKGLTFNGCESLEEINIPASVKSIGKDAFAKCRSLEVIEIPENVTSIEQFAFSECENVKNIILPDGLQKLGKYAFQSCKSLEKITIPNAITFFEGTFDSCISLKEINILGDITKIGEKSFFDCESLEEITIPNTVDEIGEKAFFNCLNLKDIYISESVKKIHDQAFFGCEKIEKITMGSGVHFGKDVFGDYVVKGTTTDSSNISYSIDFSEKTLYISGSGSLEEYSETKPAPWKLFEAVVSNIVIDGSVDSIGAYSFYNMDSVENIVILDGVLRIGESAFESCDNIVYVDLPASIKYVGKNAFGDCDNLEELVFAGYGPMVMNSFASSKNNIITAYYPQYTSGWSNVIKEITSVNWMGYDKTRSFKDIVLVLDTSDTMRSNLDSLIIGAKYFVNHVAGVRNGARVSVVQFSDDAIELSELTCNRSVVNREIDLMNSYGSTQYLKALNKADEILSASDAEEKYVVFFSDGDPTDDIVLVDDKISYIKDKYNVYTVFYGSYDNGRMRSMASSILNYFCADSVEKLIEAFISLSVSYDVADEICVWMTRDKSETFGLATGKIIQKFVKGADEKAVIQVEPSKTFVPYKYVLVQKGIDVATSYDGKFVIRPGKIFNTSDVIELYLYDDEEKLVKTIKLSIKIVDGYLVAYKLRNDSGEWTTRYIDVVHDGSEIKNIDPSLDTYGYEGLTFRGWYRSKDAYGYDFFNEKSGAKRKITDDIELYAFWDSKKNDLVRGQENWIFGNSGTEFVSSDYHSLSDLERGKRKYFYDILDSDFEKLIDCFKAADRPIERLIKEKNSIWEGSCYGMSVSTILAKAGAYDINDFDSSIYNLGDKEHLDLNPSGTKPMPIESMINYYYLSQFIFDREFSTYSEHLKQIINKMKKTEYPVVLDLSLYYDRTIGCYGGHAVVAYDLVADDSKGIYTFKIYDCNCPEYEFEIRVLNEGGNYTIDTTYVPEDFANSIKVWASFYSDGNERVFIPFFEWVDTVEDFTTIDTLKPVKVSNSSLVTLKTNYRDFEIIDGNKKAVVKDGQIVSGEDIVLEAHGNVAYYNAEAEYEFLISKLSDENEYNIIINSEGLNHYSTTINQNDSFYNIDSVDKANITINGKSEIFVDGDKITEHSIFYGNTAMQAPWEVIIFEVNADSFAIGTSEDGITISSAENTIHNIEVTDGLNDLSFSNIAQKNISISSDNNRNCIIKNIDDSEVINTKNFGYRVVFDSNGGDAIDSYKNIASNSKIVAPENPTKKGFYFTGWYKNQECNLLWDFNNDLVTNDETLYAGWEIDPYYVVQVTFKLYGLKEEAIYITTDQKLQKDICPVPDVDDKNWYIDPDCTRLWNFEEDVIEQDIVLYSKKWEEINPNLPEEQVPNNPSPIPTVKPSAEPSVMPSPEPTVKPSAEPSAMPSPEPTVEPSAIPSMTPSPLPSSVPDVPAEESKNVLVVKQSTNISEYFDLSLLNTDEKVDGYYISEGKNNASINRNGIIKPRKPGVIAVEAYKFVGNNRKTKEVVDTVKFTIIKPQFDKLGMKGRRTGQTVDVTQYIVLPSNQTIEWKSSNKSVADINSDGIITVGNKMGKAVITAIITNDDNKSVKIKGTFVVKIPKLSKKEIKLKVGKTAKIFVKNITDSSLQSIVWQTSDSEVAVYDETLGKVVAKGSGKATITATIEGVTYNCDVYVK